MQLDQKTEKKTERERSCQNTAIDEKASFFSSKILQMRLNGVEIIIYVEYRLSRSNVYKMPIGKKKI